MKCRGEGEPPASGQQFETLHSSFPHFFRQNTELLINGQHKPLHANYTVNDVIAVAQLNK